MRVPVSIARSSGTKAMYPPCVLDLTDRVLNHLAEDGALEDLIEEGCPAEGLSTKIVCSFKRVSTLNNGHVDLFFQKLDMSRWTW